jgi:hypothetical protein
MSKLALFLLFFVLVSNATFIRPWDNASWIATNPNIVSTGVEIWWNLPELQKTLDSFQLPEETQNSAVDGEIWKARDAKNTASKNYYGCMALPELVKLWGNQAQAPVAVFQSFSAAFSCVEYEKNWKLALDHSLTALELSETQALNSISTSRRTFDRIRFLGLCNLSFRARPDDICNSGEIAFSSYDSHQTEGNFGAMSIFQNHSEELSNQLRSHNPDLSFINLAFGLLWGTNGTIQTHERITNKSLEAVENANMQYEILQSIAHQRKRTAEGVISELEKQKIHLISRATSSTELDFAGTIRDYFVRLQEEKSQTDQELQEAGFVRNSIFLDGCLATAISQTNKTANKYSHILSETDSIRNAARLAVKQQMEEAKTELERTQLERQLNPASIELLQKANKSFVSAQKSTVMGVQYEKYSESTILARMARSQRSSESQILIQTSISKLQTLIKNARTDDIDVTTEEETLSLLGGLEEYEIDAYVQSAISNIISKARLKYADDLMRKRSSLIKKISLGGSSTQDLKSELQKFETGVVVDGSILFPESIGHLKQLKSNYAYVEDELALHLGDVVGNSMAGSATPIFSPIYLDTPADIVLDVVLTNPMQYGARNVQVPVTASPQVPFLYSDVVSGKGSLSGLYTDSEYLYLTFSNVSPFEQKRLTLSKSMVIAHTESKSVHAVAIGNGMALVKEVLEFQLDMPIPHLELLQDNYKATIDGASATRPLDSGKHKLRLEYYVPDAYMEAVSNLKSYPIGPKSQIEYVITITPTIDLDVVPILVESTNNSGISSMSIYAITGEKMTKPKKLSENAHSADISNLVANVPAKIHISYLVEDSKSFFESELLPYRNLELGPDAKKLFDQAEQHASGGNYSQAIELIKQLQATHKSEQKQLDGMEKKIAVLSGKLQNELSELNEHLPAETLASPFLSKLEARRIELAKISSNVPKLNVSERLAALEAIDFRWIGKELNAHAKSSYKEYNDLKERFYVAGNSTTASEFMTFESSLNRFQASPRVEYAVAVVDSLEEVRSLVKSQEVLLSEELSERKHMFEKFKEKTNSILEPYSKQLSAAKGTDYSGRFAISSSTVEKQLKDVGNSIDSDPRIFNGKLESLNISLRKMYSILSSLENESLSTISLNEHLIIRLPDSDSKSNLIDNLRTMKKLHESSEYVNSLRAGVAISEKLKQEQNPDGDGLLMLGISAMAILAILAFYLFKPKPKPALKKVPKLGDF